jgi:hypothetical protein
MAHNQPFSQEGKDIQQLQKWEQQVFARLEEARQLQARALKQCAQNQARVARLEERLQALRKRLSAPQSDEDVAETTETDGQEQSDEAIVPPQIAEQAESLAAFLPENGDLDALSFPVQEGSDQEATERMAVLQIDEQAESMAAFLPENGDLDALSFPVQEGSDQEATERIAILRMEEQR